MRQTWFSLHMHRLRQLIKHDQQGEVEMPIPALFSIVFAFFRPHASSPLMIRLSFPLKMIELVVLCIFAIA